MLLWSSTLQNGEHESARGIFIVCNVPVPYYIECVIETTVISSDLHIPQSMVLCTSDHPLRACMSNTAESARGIFIVCNVPVRTILHWMRDWNYCDLLGSPYTTEYGTLSVLLCIFLLRFYFCVFFVTFYVFSEEIEIFIFIQNRKRGYVRYVKDKKTPWHPWNIRGTQFRLWSRYIVI